MKNLSANQQKWLKAIHLFFACLWVGGAFSITLMGFLLKAKDGGELYGQNFAKLIIDYFVIIPGAMGCLATGILYAVFTRWGWFKHTWIIAKWCITAFGIIFGTFWLGFWMEKSAELSKIHGIDALMLPEYIKTHQLLDFWGVFQLSTLLFALFISTIKPWKILKS